MMTTDLRPGGCMRVPALARGHLARGSQRPPLHLLLLPCGVLLWLWLHSPEVFDGPCVPLCFGPCRASIVQAAIENGGLDTFPYAKCFADTRSTIGPR